MKRKKYLFQDKPQKLQQGKVTKWHGYSHSFCQEISSSKLVFLFVLHSLLWICQCPNWLFCKLTFFLWKRNFKTRFLSKIYKNWDKKFTILKQLPTESLPLSMFVICSYFSSRMFETFKINFISNILSLVDLFLEQCFL